MFFFINIKVISWFYKVKMSEGKGKENFLAIRQTDVAEFISNSSNI